VCRQRRQMRCGGRWRMRWAFQGWSWPKSIEQVYTCSRQELLEFVPAAEVGDMRGAVAVPAALWATDEFSL